MIVSVSNETTSKSLTVHYRNVVIEDDPTDIRVQLRIPEQYFLMHESLQELIEQFIRDFGSLTVKSVSDSKDNK